VLLIHHYRKDIFYRSLHDIDRCRVELGDGLDNFEVDTIDEREMSIEEVVLCLILIDHWLLMILSIPCKHFVHCLRHPVLSLRYLYQKRL